MRIGILALLVMFGALGGGRDLASALMRMPAPAVAAACAPAAPAEAVRLALLR